MRTPEISRFENVPQEPDRYIYRIRSTRRSSAGLGPCEACSKHCSEVFYQVEGKTYLTDALDEVPNQIEVTFYECRNYFGHEECLKGVRR